MGKHNNRPRHNRKRNNETSNDNGNEDVSVRADPIYGSGGDKGSTRAEMATTDLSSLLGPEQIVPIVAKLGSTNADERSWAAAGVSNLLLDAVSRDQLVRAGVSRALLAALTNLGTKINKDNNNTSTNATDHDEHAVRVDLAGALANLAAFGGPEVRADLVRRGAVDALVTCLLTHENSSDINSTISVSSFKFPFMRQVVASLWSLAEDSQDALTAISSNNLFVSVLFTPLQPLFSTVNGNSLELVTVCLQCLNTLSESNKLLDNFVTSNSSSIFPLLSRIVSDPSSALPDPFRAANVSIHSVNLARVLAASILTNLAHLAPSLSISFFKLASAASSIVDFDLTSVSSAILNAATTGVVDGTTLTTAAERTYEEAVTALSSIQLALELLANSYSEDYVHYEGDDEYDDFPNANNTAKGDDIMDAGDDDDNDDEDNAFDEMMQDEDLAANIAAESGTTADTDTDTKSHTTNGNSNTENFDRVQTAEKLNIVAIILRIVSAASPDMSLITAENPIYGYISLLTTVKLRAFGCLQNIFSCLSESGKGKWYSSKNSQNVNAIWATLFEAANASTASVVVSNTAEMIESAVGAIWALALGVDASKLGSKIVLTPTNSQVQNLISSATLPTPTAALCVKCISTLGILAKHPATTIPLNQKIGLFLLQTASSSSTKLESVSEALNAIYDVYGDTDYEYDAPVFVGGGFLVVLKEFLPKFRARVKACDKRKFRVVRERADEALLNLSAFISYKEHELKGKK
ncbi:hypothetical protein HK100_007701 [Physocladia obscura]|uniref:SYO1-like TPR repeats domain-containing protein n=1 Tax=Physocladia obscura TaxID=109957 RepID=A0AAD5X6R9_9FUNG|nr:hypothetical protein HK100_007701 [Physocladia obscura]